MPVYVDNAQIPYGRMKMCHVLADTQAELLDMVKKINIDPKPLEHEGMENEHFNISMTYREKAIKEGAIEVDSRALVALIRRKRQALAKQAKAAPVGLIQALETSQARITLSPVADDLEVSITDEIEDEQSGHLSDCAVHNAPAMEPEACDCGFTDQQPDEETEAEGNQD